MPETLLQFGYSHEIIILVIAALPIIELRGAIPVAINLFNMPWYYSLTLAVIGNMLPVPLILFFLNKTRRLLRRVPALERGLNWVLERSTARGSRIARYGPIGLLLFVAVPLPFTGAWTGSLISVLLGYGIKSSFIYILIGVCIAGAIVTCLALAGWVGAAIAGLALSALAISFLWRSLNR